MINASNGMPWPPDYTRGNLLNLVQSVAVACGDANPPNPELSSLTPDELWETRHIVLLVVDGLGQKTLDESRVAPNLASHWRTTLTSVFPSTTASAITAFMSGLAPSQHGLTGWHMYLEEIGRTLAILPMTPREEPPVQPAAPDVTSPLLPELFDYPTLFQRLGRESWVLSPQSIAGSPFNAWHTRGAKVVPYATLPQLFEQLQFLMAAETPRFIYAYYPELDTVSHRFGTSSDQARETLAAFDAAFGDLMTRRQEPSTWMLVTADHGFIDSPPERVISLDDHPRLAACLARPLCGERRAAYAYVLPERRVEFESYVEEHLSESAILEPSAELIGRGWFGPPPVHRRLASRVGDYTLLMKGNWTIKDWLPWEKRYVMIGVHGGTSADEMLIPLIAAKI